MVFQTQDDSTLILSLHQNTRDHHFFLSRCSRTSDHFCLLQPLSELQSAACSALLL
nr:MAG TPA: hypothetical protein [Caudoviricetes sp.]